MRVLFEISMLSGVLPGVLSRMLPGDLGADFWAGDATKHFSVKKKKKNFSVKRGEAKGNPVKRSGPFSDPPDSEN